MAATQAPARGSSCLGLPCESSVRARTCTLNLQQRRRNAGSVEVRAAGGACCSRAVMQNPYSVLGVSPGASKQDIKRAYRSLALKHHPDIRNGCEERFRQINHAYESMVKIQGAYQTEAGHAPSEVFSPAWEISADESQEGSYEVMFGTQGEPLIDELLFFHAMEERGEVVEFSFDSIWG